MIDADDLVKWLFNELKDYIKLLDKIGPGFYTGACCQIERMIDHIEKISGDEVD